MGQEECFDSVGGASGVGGESRGSPGASGPHASGLRDPEGCRAGRLPKREVSPGDVSPAVKAGASGAENPGKSRHSPPLRQGLGERSASPRPFCRPPRCRCPAAGEEPTVRKGASGSRASALSQGVRASYQKRRKKKPLSFFSSPSSPRSFLLLFEFKNILLKMKFPVRLCVAFYLKMSYKGRE